MPFPRNWSEELISEWLQIDGYLVETGVVLSTSARGGRMEADVLGVKVKNDRLIIRHLEIGSLPGNPKASEEHIKNKFSTERKSKIRKYVTDWIGFKGYDIDYRPLYVATWLSYKAMNHLKQKDLPVKTLMELVHNDIRDSVTKWKNNPPHKPKTTGKHITLPDNLWLLKMLDFIKYTEE